MKKKVSNVKFIPTGANRSIRDKLKENAETTLIAQVNKDMSSCKSETKELNENITTALMEKGNTLISLAPNELNINDIKERRGEIKKANYHYPDVLNVGSLVSQSKTPSDIYPDNNFNSEIPLLIPTQKSGLAFLMNNKYKDVILGELESAVLNMILSLPDGLVKLTLIDKAGSGQNFTNLTRLNDKFVSGRVLTEDSEIEEELSVIKTSMGKISQAINANGFKSPEDYNNNTDEIPQRYNFIVINNFPTGFNKKASENLFSLIESGHKSGMYVFLTSEYDHISGLTKEVNGMPLGTFLSLMTLFQYSDRSHQFMRDGLIPRNVEMIKSPIINEEKFKKLANSTFKIKMASEKSDITSKKVTLLNDGIKNISLKPMINLSKLIPPRELWHSKDASQGISVPFGKVGIEPVSINLGINQYGEVENVHHGLFCGATGSGKTVLIHDVILQASMLYSPETLQFYLLDYKQGTEFALYKNFPQVQILSMESEIEFGQDVLRRAVHEIKVRGDLFKAKDVSNLKGYNAAVAKEDMLPRIIIIIDEFQELFPKDREVTSISNELFDKVLRLGRSFGINLIAATQTLLGVDLDEGLYSNMPLRVGLQMQESDAAIVFGENNLAAKYLTDPGEGIYNASFGIAKNNIPFQAAFVDSTDVNRYIDEITHFIGEELSQEAMTKLLESRFVYTGDNEGRIENIKSPKKGHIYIGEPVGLKKTHEYFEFQTEFGENLLIVGGNDKHSISVMCNTLRQASFKTYLGVFSVSASRLIEKELEDLENIEIFKNETALSVMKEVFSEYQARFESKSQEKERIILALSMVESCKFLNTTEKSEERVIFEELLLSGAEYGIHIILQAQDYATLTAQEVDEHLGKFKKKIAITGGNSEKILSKTFKPSRSKHVAVFEAGTNGIIKFKPYILNLYNKLEGN